VRGNKGARSAGVDGETAYYVETVRGEEQFLAELRASLKDRSFRPLPVRERLIPKPGSTKRRRLGIATVRDRVVQAALKLVLEPIWETDFRPCSYGFRPGRRAQDAIAEIHHLASHSYEWVLDGDITACFDELSHSALQARVQERIVDKRVLALVKAFLKAGILTEDGAIRDTIAGTPQGGILSPLLSNLALSVLDEHITEHGQAAAPSWVRERRRRQGQPNYRIVTRMTSWCSWPATATTPRRCGSRSRRSWPRSACDCRRRRPPSRTSRRALSFWGGASSAISSEGASGDTSTPIPRGRRWPP
jgi:RNA-directed DNA polymerase